MAWEPDYVTLAEFKDYFNIDDNEDDLRIPFAITAASRAIDSYCSNRRNGVGFRRQFGLATAAENRYYTARWVASRAQWVIEIDDTFSAAPTVAIDLNRDAVYESSITAIEMLPKNAAANQKPYTAIAVRQTSSIQPSYWPDACRVFDQFGWTTSPTTVKTATLIQSRRFHKRIVAPFGVKGSPQKGTEQSILDKLDSDVEFMLSSNGLIRLGWTE